MSCHSKIFVYYKKFCNFVSFSKLSRMFSSFALFISFLYPFAGMFLPLFGWRWWCVHSGCLCMGYVPWCTVPWGHVPKKCSWFSVCATVWVSVLGGKNEGYVSSFANCCWRAYTKDCNDQFSVFKVVKV